MTHRAASVLVINSGSSSLKYQLFRFAAANDTTAELRPAVLTAGLIERIGERGSSRWTWRMHDGAPRSEPLDAPDHAAALAAVHRQFETEALRIDVCGHRVVHGGVRFSAPTLVDADTLAYIRECAVLAPLHNPANAAGIEVAQTAFPSVAQVAVFDTAFHTATMPEVAWRYPLPRELADRLGIRKFGFHGTSHRYVHRAAARFLRKPSLSCITLHLGNGCSLAAIENGAVIDTSMGMTPLAGVAMGSRSGDLDPSIPLLLCSRGGLSPAEAQDVLNAQSGLRGLCGRNDVREIERCAQAADKADEEAGQAVSPNEASAANRRGGVREVDAGTSEAQREAQAAELALRIYSHRIRHYLGAYWLQLGGQLDALIFTAGVGENSAGVRARVLEGLAHMGAEVDVAANERATAGHPERPEGDVLDISTAASRVRILVVRTNEELEIAEAARAVVLGVAGSDDL